jgi:uncharacterized protein (TIRG00374 family)
LRDWKAWVGIGVSAFLLWWVFRGEDLVTIGQQFASADPVMLIFAGALSMAGGLVRALRWRLLLEPLGVPIPLYARWKALIIGFTVTNLALGRLGEVARPYALSKMVPVSTSGALGTVVLERVLDIVALIILLFVTLLAPTFPSDATVVGRPIEYAVAGAVGVGSVALGIVALLALWPDRISGLARTISYRLPGRTGGRIADALEAFLTGLDLLRRPTPLLKALLWSLVLWLWMAASFWAAFSAFGIELGFTAALFTQCVVAVFISIPAGPGFIGTLQAGVLVALSGVFSVPENQALSMSVGYHLAGYIPVTMLGLYYTWTLRLRIRSVRAEAKAATQFQGD